MSFKKNKYSGFKKGNWKEVGEIRTKEFTNKKKCARFLMDTRYI